VAQGAAAYRDRRFSTYDGLSLYYRDWGDPISSGTPILCLPGLARNCQDFDDFAHRLATKRRVVCLDYRGRGRSDYDRNWENYAPAIYLRDALDLLTAIDVHRVVVVGTSLGGFIAMAMAVARPSALAGVVLNDIGPEIHGAALGKLIDYVATYRPQADWESAAAFLKENFKRLGLTSNDDWMKIAKKTFREGADSVLRYDFDPGIAKNLAGAAEAVRSQWPLFRALAHIPTLAFRGADSDILDADTFARMAAEKPDLIAVTVPNRGHAPLLDEPECTGAIDDFLASL
jgi:pimeloyl-ACP methyl ester carboxylesterase